MQTIQLIQNCEVMVSDLEIFKRRVFLKKLKNLRVVRLFVYRKHPVSEHDDLETCNSWFCVVNSAQGI